MPRNEEFSLKSWKVTSPTIKSKLLGFVSPTATRNTAKTSSQRNLKLSVRRETERTIKGKLDSVLGPAEDVDRKDNSRVRREMLKSKEARRNVEVDVLEQDLTCANRR